MPGPVPCTVPTRAARVGTAARPRVRPLVEVLGEVTPAPAAPPPDAAVPDRVQERLDHLARAVRPVAARLLTAVVEVLDARRPVAHLAARADATVLAALTTARTRSRRPEGRLHGLRVCAVAPRTVEVAAVVGRGGRAQAVAARLEFPADAPEGAWRITVLVLG